MFKRSSFCNLGNCVEVELEDGATSVVVRDSKDPGGAGPMFTKQEWADLVAGAKAGEFDA